MSPCTGNLWNSKIQWSVNDWNGESWVKIKVVVRRMVEYYLISLILAFKDVILSNRTIFLLPFAAETFIQLMATFAS